MTEDRLPLADLLAKSGDADFLRGVAEAVLQMLMEADVEGLIGAGRHERTGERLNWRNGFRDRTLDTRLGALQLRIPKLRQGRHFPPLLEPRKTSEKALVAVIQEAWIGGVSTRRVDDLVQAMGLSGISKSTVSKLCKARAARSASAAAQRLQRATSGSAPSSPGRWRASGPTCGWPPPHMGRPPVKGVHRVISRSPTSVSERPPGLSPSPSWPYRTGTTSHSVGAQGSRTMIPPTAGRAQEGKTILR